MEYTKNIYVLGDGFGYEILCNGAATIRQDFDPVLAGDVQMSEDRANDAADVVLSRLTVG